jgi:hypothetical protein
MDRLKTVAQLPDAFGVTSDRPLGSGQESDVFAIVDWRVLRLYRAAASMKFLIAREPRCARHHFHGRGDAIAMKCAAPGRV